MQKGEQKIASHKQYVLYLCEIVNKTCRMKNVTPRMIEGFLLKNWFQVALIGIIGLALLRNGSEAFGSVNEKLVGVKSVTQPKIQKMGMSFVPSWFTEKAEIESKPVAKAPKKKVSSGIAMDSRVQAFIDRFAEVAAQEHSKYNIPASVILANGILLSDLGHSTLANEAQNFFMVPCTRSWDGDSMEIGDGCFRWYGSPWESFRDHSLFICREAGNSAMQISERSIVEWAKTIEKIGWTNLQAKDILRTIRKYDLLAFDVRKP